MKLHTHEELLVEHGQLKRELAETRQLLWLVLREYGEEHPSRRIMQARVNKADLRGDYDIELMEPRQSPGTVIITARTK